MPGASFQTVLAFAATLSYPLAKIGESTYPSVFCQVYATCLLLWAVYRFILYPNIFSPLRHIPTVDGNSWWSRQSLRLLSEPRGIPQSDWYFASFYLTVPHRNYITWFNRKLTQPLSVIGLVTLHIMARALPHGYKLRADHRGGSRGAGRGSNNQELPV